MKNNSFRNSLLFFILPLSLIYADETVILIPGDALPSIPYSDQFDKPSPLPNDLEKIIFISDMDASKISHPILLKEGNAYLEKYKTVIISDIHKMPSLISRFVALPKMREYPYTIRLIREEKIGDPFPRNKGQVTCIDIKSDKIIKIEFAENEVALRQFIEANAVLKNKK
ncbi:hypothetical protein EHQ58_17080 [Leptospira ognonensis]|uniref:Uncharacterized protein n=1 Tax=Leptospira ognonensis TaxID=2484945 RepID=A0A4R9JVJ8_9LEPT|nr:hypothetical protein [Leptospira ognonensis]TGL56341.1 hypothetical protein EHQ58_17080 [Leptospira ognonensis]